MIFDQYSRYAALVRILRHIGSRDATILDVGSGPECLLGAMIEEACVSYVDPLITSPNDARHVTGAVHSPMLLQRSFEIVCAVDVLEHVHPDSRESFLKRLSSLATEGLVIGFPTSDSGHSSEVDAAVNDAYKQVYGNDYPWLAEHFSNGLPSVAATCDRLKQLGWHCQAIGHGYVPWLKALLSEVVCYWEIPHLQPLVLDTSETFNKELAAYDFLAPHYRTFILASRSPLPPYRLKVISEAKKKKLMNRFREVFDSMKSRYATNSLAFLKSQQHEIHDANTRLREVANWGLSSSEDVAKRDTVVLELMAKNTELSDWAKNLADNLKDRDARVQVLSKKIEELVAWGNQLSSQLATRDAQVLETNAKIADLSAWGTKLSAEATQKNQLITELSRKVEETSAWGTKLSAEATHKNQLIVELSRKVEETSAWGTKLSAEATHKNQLIAELSRKVEETSAWGTRLSAEATHKNQLIAELSRKLEETSAWGTKLSAEAAHKNQLIVELSRKLEETSAWGTKLSAEATHKNQLIAELSRKLEETSAWGTKLSAEATHKNQLIAELSRKLEETSAWGTKLSAEATRKDQLVAELSRKVADI